MTDLKFQSILLICRGIDQEKEIKNLAEKYKIDPKNTLDFSEISPQKKQISIDQIRELKGHIFQKPQKAEVKFVAIKNADMLTIEAQNALLKLLEEPPTHAVIVLSTERKQKLLPTVRSRTVEIEIRPKAKIRSDGLEFSLNSFDEALTILSEVEDPKTWIDLQIESNYQNLLDQVKKNNPAEIKSITKKIEDLSYSKKLIEANVNPKFVLFNLALSASI